MIRVLLALALILMLFMPGMPPLADTVPQAPVTESTDEAVKANVLQAYGKLPILFVHNQGQLDDRVEYYVKASGQTLYFTHENIVFDLIRYEEAQAVDLADRKAERMVFSLDFLGTNESPAIEGRNKDEAIVNYFIGNDPEKWHTDIPTYREVVYSDIYPDVDLRLYGRGSVLEYEFVVNPGSRVSDIELAYTGVDSLAIEDGELVASTAFGDIKQTQPYIYQRIGDQVVEVDGGFRLAGSNAYGFQVAAYDTGYPVIIDPTLGYSTFLGGAGADVGCGIAVDAANCAYVTGATNSVDFPMLNSYNGTYGGNDDAFVTKFNAAGNTLAYSTYLGGGGTDYGFRIAVDASGCAYVTGETESVDFPTTLGSYNGTWSGNSDAFVTKFNAAGNTLAYSTFVGGAGDDIGYGIAVDAANCAYVTGETESVDFPTTLGSYNGTWGGNSDAFVTKFNAAGNTLAYSTYLGGGSNDYGYGIAVDAANCAYVTGYTHSVDFPMQNSYNGTWGGNWDAFVTKFNAAGNTLAYSTYLGGAGGSDAGFGIAVDAFGCAYVTGQTESVDFPMQNSYNGTWSGNDDAFVTKFNAAGNALAYSTFLGGAGNDYAQGIAVDAANCAYVTGYTESVDFPMQNPYQGTYSGNADAFVTKFNAAGNTLAYSTYLGGAGGNDWGWGIAVDASGCAYVTGETESVDFPMLNSYDTTLGGDLDAFVTKLGDPDITVSPTSLDFGSVAVGSSSPAQTVTVRNDGCGVLTIGTITLGGTNADQFSIQNDNVSGHVLLPAASATLQVVFSPTSASAKAATMAIPSDDPDEPTVNVALSGTGTQAQQQQRRVSPGGGTVTGTQGQTPPEIMLAYMNVHPQQQYAGQPVTITTNVSNTGGSTGQYTVTLMIDGQVEETRMVSVGAQSALPVKFTVTRDVPGTYTVTIGSQQASFTVVGSSTTGSSASDSLIAIVIMGVLVLITAVGLIVVLRRRAW